MSAIAFNPGGETTTATVTMQDGSAFVVVGTPAQVFEQVTATADAPDTNEVALTLEAGGSVVLDVADVAEVS